MAADEKKERRISRPSGFHAAIQNAAQLPFNVAAGLADEVAYQTESLGPERKDDEVDSRQLYHESNSQMHRSAASEAHLKQGSNVANQHQRTGGAAAAATDDATEETISGKLQPADSDSTAKKRALSPKKSVSIQEPVDVIGENAVEHKQAQSHLVASRGTGSDDSGSASSSVSSHLPLRPFNDVFVMTELS